MHSQAEPGNEENVSNNLSIGMPLVSALLLQRPIADTLIRRLQGSPLYLFYGADHVQIALRAV